MITLSGAGQSSTPIYAANTPESDDGQWYCVTIIIPSKSLMTAISHLRSIGGTQTSVVPVRYVFMPQSPSYERLLKTLKRA